MATSTPARPGAETLRITPALAFALVGSVALALLLARMFDAAHQIVGWTVACSVVALLVDGVVARMSRLLPRPLAVIVTLLAFVAVVGGLGARVFTELRHSVQTLERTVPSAATKLEERYQLASDLRLHDTLTGFTDGLTASLNARGLDQVKTAPTYLVTGILMLFLLVYGRRYVSSALRQIEDPGRRAMARSVLTTAFRNGRSRLLLVCAQIIVVTVVSAGVLGVIGVDASFSLGLLLGVGSVFPWVGIPAASLPAVIMALGFGSVARAALVCAFVVSLVALDVAWWRPRADRTTVEIGVFLPLVAALLGKAIYGVGGAVYGFALLVLGLALLAALDIDADGDAATWSGR